MNLLAEPEPVLVAPDIHVGHKFNGAQHSSYERPWPSYEITPSRTRPRKDGSGPDRSLADFNYSMTCITGGQIQGGNDSPAARSKPECTGAI